MKKRGSEHQGQAPEPQLVQIYGYYRGKRKINAGECKRRIARFAKKKRPYGRRFAEKRLKPLRRFSRQSLFFLTPDLTIRRCVSRVATLYKTKAIKGEKKKLIQIYAYFRMYGVFAFGRATTLFCYFVDEKGQKKAPYRTDRELNTLLTFLSRN